MSVKSVGVLWVSPPLYIDEREQRSDHTCVCCPNTQWPLANWFFVLNSSSRICTHSRKSPQLPPQYMRNVTACTPYIKAALTPPRLYLFFVLWVIQHENKSDETCNHSELYFCAPARFCSCPMASCGLRTSRGPAECAGESSRRHPRGQADLERCEKAQEGASQAAEEIDESHEPHSHVSRRAAGDGQRPSRRGRPRLHQGALP